MSRTTPTPKRFSDPAVISTQGRMSAALSASTPMPAVDLDATATFGIFGAALARPSVFEMREDTLACWMLPKVRPQGKAGFLVLYNAGFLV